MTLDRRVILLTGLSGAGKTTATKSLEDIGFRTIDNLPHELLLALVEKIAADPQRFARVCLVLDARDGDPSETIELVRTGTAAIGVSARIIYLDARDDVLIRRFSETRHRHPLGGAVDAPRSVADAIAAERMLLSATRESADAVIDTSDLSGRELRDRLVAEVLESDERVAIRLTSFGYKHGIPLEADLVFDVRAAANPHWVPELRPLDGRSPEISSYVLGDPIGASLLQSVENYLAASVPAYLADGRGRLSVAIGCTGGRHRSVAIVEALARRLPAIVGSPPIVVEHRDLARS
jgi:UPF0042 nucleotide-binding protein